MQIGRLLPTLLLLGACSPGSGPTTIDATTTFDMVAGQRQPFANRLTDSYGAPLQGHVTWTSTDPAVATIDQDGVVTAMHTGATNVSGISDHSSAAVEIAVHQGGMVNPDSGSIYSDDGTFWVTRRAGVFGLGALTFTPLATPQLPNAIAGTAWGIQVGTFNSLADVVATIRYDPAKLPPATNQRHLQFRRLDGGAIGGNIVDTAAHTVTVGASTDGRGMVLMVEPVQIDSLHLTFPWTLHVGNHEPVNLQAFGRDATGVAIAWTSDDPATISVSAGGEASALRPGTVAIHAKMDGVIGTILVTALP